jgi:D-alanyl-D-alanine carboxypeptidase
MKKSKINEELPRRLLDKMIDNKRIFSAVMRVENSDGSFSWSGAAGNMQEDSRYFIASVTKLYVTALVLWLVEENRIALYDKISSYLPESFCKQLHALKGGDYSNEITIRHLISNTSGLPDYFFHKQDNGKTVADDLMEGKDEYWPLERTIELIKNLKPNFKPGAKGKAAYSDSNYQLLGKIIENVAGKGIGDVFHDLIFSQLNLQNTYAYSDINDRSPVPFYYNSKQLWLPKYMTSITAEGGIVSTAEEVMLFLKAFFRGDFFPKDRIEELKQWNMIFPPPGLFYFGIGLEKLWIPWFLSPFKPIGDIVGFWGQTGTFAFYNPQTDLYFCGATNQINGAGHRVATNAMLKMIKSALYEG